MAAQGPEAPRASSAGRIEAALVEEIAAGGLEPGARLDETRLAARFGTSRTPVREALGRLLAQGVLSGAPRRGVRVAVYSREELAQMFEAMQEIEAACARLAAQRLTLMGRARLEAAHRACAAAAEAGDIPAYLRANEAFHLEIYAATQNVYVREMAADFRRRTGPFRAKKFRTRNDLLASVEGHATLLATILSADSQTAYDGMRAHLTRTYLEVLRAI